jgi:hypothetical protein
MKWLLKPRVNIFEIVFIMMATFCVAYSAFMLAAIVCFIGAILALLLSVISIWGN